MAKQKKSKFSFTKTVVITVILGVSAYLLFSVVTEVRTTISLTKELKLINAELENIQNETEDLKERKDKLNDPEYIKSYARGEYSLTKEGEQVFHLPSSKDKTDKKESDEADKDESKDKSEKKTEDKTDDSNKEKEDN